MKHILPLAILTIAVASGSYVAVHAHHDAIHQLTLQNARTQATQAKARVQAALAAHKQAEVTEAKLNKLKKQCQDYTVVYNQLTASQKKNAVKPDCGI